MRKTIYMLTLVLVMGICIGCDKENTEIENPTEEEQSISTSSEKDEFSIE